ITSASLLASASSLATLLARTLGPLALLVVDTLNAISLRFWMLCRVDRTFHVSAQITSLLLPVRYPCVRSRWRRQCILQVKVYSLCSWLVLWRDGWQGSLWRVVDLVLSPISPSELLVR